MRQTALRNKKGVTLVEVMIALVILLVVFMGLIQASLLSIENTATTALRDEAVRLAAETVTALKASPFDDLDRKPATNPDPNFTLSSTGSATERGNASRLGINTVRTSRNLASNYVIDITIDNRFDGNNTQVTVLVKWDWKERTIAGGNPNTHQVVALLRRTI
jgi:prepilin-type N-terminal cleavage/methylation domain-containing protein